MADIDDIKRKKMEEMKNSARADKPVSVSDSSFPDFIKKHSVVVIDAYADWCGPCRMMGPAIDELAGEFAGKVAFGKLDVDANPLTAAAYGIMSIPTVLFFKGGEHIDTAIGFGGKEPLKKKVEELLG